MEKIHIPRCYGITLAFVSTLGGACTGELGSPVGQDTSAVCGTRTQPGPSPIRRLTRFEYDNTIRDLVGDDSKPSRDFPPEEQALGFNNNAATLGVTQLLAEQYMVAAEGIAARATAADKITTLLGCDPVAMGEEACITAFITKFGQRAWRRPLAADEIDRHRTLFRTTRAAYDLPTGVQVVVQALLQSPHFLYRVEQATLLAPKDNVVQVTGYEMASRLSYFLIGTMPDDALFAAAAAGELSTPEQIAAQARRLLDDPRARVAVRNFHTQWLKVDQVQIASKDPAIYPGFDPALRDSMQEGALAFMDDVLWNGDGTLDTLLTAPYAMMNAKLAGFYGVSGPTGDAFQRVELDPTKYAGVLTQPSLLAALAKPNQSAPVQRGKFVREQLLCQILPPPPPGVDITPPDLDPNLTTRERFAQHDRDPVCAGCHHLMDPIGFGFEGFDGAGRFRATENGLPIDTSGEIFASKDADGKFTGAPGLARQLVSSQQLHDCVATQWFRFAYGRVETRDDACTIESLDHSFASSGYNIKELLVSLTQTDAFRYRKAVTGGGS